MTPQNASAASALPSLSRNVTSTRPPVKIKSATLIDSELMSWRSSVAIGSASCVAIRIASDSATPKTNAQVMRRLTARLSGEFLRGFEAGLPFGKRVHDAPALGCREAGPGGDFLHRAAAAEAQATPGIERADLHARGCDQGDFAHQKLGRQSSAPAEHSWPWRERNRRFGLSR